MEAIANATVKDSKKENHKIFTEFTTCVPRNVDMKEGYVDSIIDHTFRQN